MSKRCCCIIPLRGGVIINGILIAIVSIAIIGATLAHKNPMVIHLGVVHSALPWVYLGCYIASAVIAIIMTISGASAKLSLMRLTKFLIWIFFVLFTIFQALSFILSLTNRSKSMDICEAVNPPLESSGSTNSTVTLGGYTTTFLGMQYGNTYGLANCSQAVQAGVIGGAVLLFVGQFYMLYSALIVGSFTAKLRERKLGHRLRDLEWDDNLDELATRYKADTATAPKYPMKDLKQKKKKGLLSKLSFGKS
ncbi:hypothetical protein BDB01DRAFT_777484 [Pilobolus umbonatus]|nr:hypothetical protein BDB01DRAFT_777484 [Pilobolus umbonatus]